MPTVTRREWLWTAVWSVVLLMLAALPYLYGHRLSTPEVHFSGFVIGLEDGLSYLTKMQEGRAGGWLFYLAYTPELHPSELFFIYYLLLGKAAGWLNLSNELFFHLSKVAAIPLSLLAFYYFAAYFNDTIKVRQIAWLIAGFSGGLGWLWLAAGGPAQLGAMPVDLWVPDASFFLAALTYPHLPLAQGLLLLFIITALEFIETGRAGLGLAAAGCGLAVSLIHPYTLPVIGVVLGLYVLSFYSTPRLLGSKGLRLLAVTLPSLPYLIYVLWVFNHNPAFIAWKEQSLTFSPAPLHYLLGFGLSLFLAGWGLWVTCRHNGYKYRFLRLWLISVPFLLYMPLALQRRFLDGYQAPLALLAAMGWLWLLEKLVRPRWQWPVTAITLFLLALTNILLVLGALLTLNQRSEPLFIHSSQVDAAHWLAQQPDTPVILSAYTTGNYLPAVATVRVFVGHGPETAHSVQKQAQVEQFFNRATADAWRRDLLQQFNISYVYYGPNEQAAGEFKPETAPYLQKVYQNEVVTIFRVLDNW